jgi:hypothetical protein
VTTKCIPKWKNIYIPKMGNTNCMRRKAQISLILLICLLLVLTVGILYLNRQPVVTADNSVKIPSDFVIANEFSRNCVESKLGNVLKTVGNQGGYYKIPDNTPIIRVPTADIPYWYALGKSRILNTKQVEYEIKRLLEDEWVECASALAPIGYSIDQKAPPVAEISIQDERVHARFTANAEFKKGTAVFDPPSMEFDQINYLGTMLKASEIFVQRIERNPTIIEISYFKDYKNLQADMYDWDDANKVVYVHENSEVGGDPMHFLAFSIQLQPKLRNDTPYIEPFSDLSTKVGEKLIIPLITKDDEKDRLYYQELTENIRINSVNNATVLEFSAPVAGNYTEFFKVIDSYGNSNILSLSVKVSE